MASNTHQKPRVDPSQLTFLQFAETNAGSARELPQEYERTWLLFLGYVFGPLLRNQVGAYWIE